jgi:hypothetical protein
VPGARFSFLVYDARLLKTTMSANGTAVTPNGLSASQPIDSSETFAPLFEGLRTAPTAPGMFPLDIYTHNRHSPCWVVLDAKAAAEKIAREVQKIGFQSLQFVVLVHLSYNHGSDLLYAEMKTSSAP